MREFLRLLRSARRERREQLLYLKNAEHLTDDEKGVVRRGRNAKSHSHPKNADLSEYHTATGFEALWGYLFLSGDNDRITELFNIIKQSV